MSGQSHACLGGSSRIFYFKLICCILCVGKALLGWGVRAVNIGLCVRCQSHSKCMYYLPKPPCGLAEPCKMINFCLAAIRKIAIQNVIGPTTLSIRHIYSIVVMYSVDCTVCSSNCVKISVRKQGDKEEASGILNPIGPEESHAVIHQFQLPCNAFTFLDKL